ncbi:hypothetical protein GCM10007160_31980 [Litchfieldella qijiaojingensis]|uniref:Nucleoside phosphorylase domain-containing protein n=1 Tax=Litchfieldella qijiaojingensis TaxID=980347 RepID=A0ABQ2Z564_9GAMM|nr:purine phosphorylase [Halomonas qijiaojingensis]GGY01646.1 hypothetical protein GCM10007160_31980 [Halomonas qijiaojingensis]
MNNRRLGILVGMRWEANTLGPLRRTDDLVWLVSGPGPERAARAARTLVEQGASALLSWGVATGLDPLLSPGSLLIPEVVHGRDGERLRPDARWRAAVLAQVGEVARGELAETAIVLQDASARRVLRASTGAVAADMESAAVLRVAHSFGMPALVIRVVLDITTTDLPAGWAAAVTPEGRIAVRRIAAQLLHPANWAPALALAQARRQAAHRLMTTAARGFDALAGEGATAT